MANKITQKDYFNGLMAFVKGEETSFTKDDFIEFIEGRIALLDKKSTSKKATKNQEENEVLKDTVLEALTDEGTTVSDLMTKSEVLGGLSNQKVSALLRMLVADGKVVKYADGKKSMFKLA